MAQIPVLWLWFITQLFDMPRSFALKLWPHVIVTPTVLFQMAVVDQAPPSKEVWLQRLRRLSELLQPAMLFQASLTLSPEGKRRDQQCIKFEESILLALDDQGRWDWR
jgi:hypothetical protein